MTGLDADVIVVGGGPAGAATAAHLTQRGHDVLVVEKARFPREKPCAEFYSPGVVGALDRLGALESILAAQPAWPRGMRICTARRSFLLAYGCTDAAGGNVGEPRSALGLPRPIFDQALLEHARRYGARVLESYRVIGVVLEGGRVVGVRLQGGRELRARFVVGADGRHSIISRSLGLDASARWPQRLGLVARYEGAVGVDTYGEMHVGSSLYCGLAPVGTGLTNVGLVGALDAKTPGEAIDRYFERRLTELPGVMRVLQHARRVTPVRGIGPLVRRVRRVAGPGYLLVGDAAGFLDPFTGEGVYRALRGAELAAESLEKGLREHGDGTGHASLYERSRDAEFGDKERVCLLVQHFLSSHRLFEYVVGHIDERPGVASLLAGVLGDYSPARPALRPSFLWALLRP